MRYLKQNNNNTSYEKIKTDVLVIGGGTAGCYGAYLIAESSDLQVTIVDRAFIKRSGCLAAGVNALNAYIGEGETIDSYLDYIKNEFGNVIREDLVYTTAKRLNRIVDQLDQLGLPILKNTKGDYVQRGKRSLKINGENFKPLLADLVKDHPQITLYEQTYCYDLITKGNLVLGAKGFSNGDNQFYDFYTKAVFCTTGGAAGLYKPNQTGASQHKMWYSPFNTGTGYAMGIKHGAEMTTFEMRFIALRCKDTIAPTGTIAQGLKSRQINKYGVAYVQDYNGKTTIDRLYATVEEQKKGNGPCFIETIGIDEKTEQELYKAYLNMAPIQVLYWEGHQLQPSKNHVQIEGTEPYIVGGHGASGYWVDTYRRTTLKGLYAAGDVCGGSPKKYVTGCLAEAEIAAETIIKDISNHTFSDETVLHAYLKSKGHVNYDQELDFSLDTEIITERLDHLESVMQHVMDLYAGGITTHYEYNHHNLLKARIEIESLFDTVKLMKAPSTKLLSEKHDLLDRLLISRVLIEHLLARKETRWKCYQANLDFNQINPNFECYINSKMNDGKIEILKRPLVSKEEIYEHKN